MNEVSLTIHHAQGTEKVPLDGDSLYVALGDDASTVILNDAAKASPHVLIRREGDRVWVSDENGISRVNGEKVEPAGQKLLSDGDEILIGDKRLTVNLNHAPRPSFRAAKGFSISGRRIVLLGCAFLLLIVMCLIGLRAWKRVRASSLFHLPLIGRAISSETAPYLTAVQKVEEDRGEAIGREAQITVPAELKHYSDRRRFLAVQNAEWRKHDYEIPHDFAELAAMIQKGEFQRVQVLGQGYLLYGVGAMADDELTHYDRGTGKEIPIFASAAELESEKGRLADALKEIEAKTREIKKEAVKLTKKDRAARAELQKRLKEAEKEAAPVKKRKELLDSFYKGEERQKLMVSEFETLATLAQNFDGRAFDLNDSSSRKDFKIRLLSCLRTPALARLEEIALAYQEKYERPLPVTSLVRTEEYQRLLGEKGNPNAIRISVPPHTTGLAFDIFTHYMTADEQNFLMDVIAQLKREGRVEALRENRDHIHVFAFADGTPPDESLIKKSLSGAAADQD